MQLVVVSDIFGITPALEDLVSEISTQFSSSVVLDPYDGKMIELENEEEAYTYFQHNIGLDEYTENVLNTVKRNTAKSLLIGFSIGASVVWRISQERIFHPQTRAVCFYGSQIRNSLFVDPVIEIDLYFPKHEEHFDVLELMVEVSRKPLVRCFKTDHLHGFMNERSENFDKAGYLEYIDLLKNM